MQKLGYPARTIIVFAALLALAVHWVVQPFGKQWIWLSTVCILVFAASLVGWRTRQLSRARERSTHILKALGAATVDIPLNLRTRMPLVLVTGDALASLFDHGASRPRLVFIGDGAIWLRVDRPQDLPEIALAMHQWRDGLPPDGVVLSIAPAFHADADALAQRLRVARQALADASRVVSARLPGYIAVYQRLTRLAPRDANAARQWYSVAAGVPFIDAKRFDAIVRTAEDEARRRADDRYASAHAAALASIIGWTQRAVFGTLTDPRQPAAPWALHGAGWIDCGPASDATRPWERDVQMQTCIAPATVDATPAPWPLPQSLIESMPRRRATSPRIVALAHAVGIIAIFAGAAFIGAGRHNAKLLDRVHADLDRYVSITPDHDAARRDALRALVADRDELDRYARTGVPLKLSFGLYHGAQLLPPLNAAIASYQPPPPPPAVVTLDSMSLFDSGKAQLKQGSARVLVEAVEMIKANPGKRILVAGHTDNVGDAASNLRLSNARAAALRDWLIEASAIPATQFAVQGYGDTRPIVPNDTPAGRAKNRRVEITLVPDTANNTN
ncbi:OmpA family protein [Caballeronia temeraria]|uniref:OmpA family protein n=1 Tax=Caballeronia temeraria TaxID=1777137 RepID=A0A158B7T4_9BURK|nr:OmpA family protein [Caballeronia temeraria]SAK66155.1 OmpA family protein [Caballeronia temeraria]